VTAALAGLATTVAMLSNEVMSQGIRLGQRELRDEMVSMREATRVVNEKVRAARGEERKGNGSGQEIKEKEKKKKKRSRRAERKWRNFLEKQKAKKGTGGEEKEEEEEDEGEEGDDLGEDGSGKEVKKRDGGGDSGSSSSTTRITHTATPIHGSPFTFCRIPQ
jgi:hypothetical protein